MSDQGTVDWLRPSDHEAFVEAQRRFQLTIVGEFETHDGVAWGGTFHVDGKLVCRIEQNGMGGPNFYHWLDRGAEREFQNLANRCYPGEFENDDKLVLAIEALEIA